MDNRSIFERYCQDKYYAEKTLRSGVMTAERRSTYIDILSGVFPEADGHLRHQVFKKHEYALVNNQLHLKKEESGVVSYLKIPSVDEFYDVIKKVHEETGHDGIRKTYQAVKMRYAYVPREVVEKFLKLCVVCQLKQRQPKQLPVKPIISSRPFERCQHFDEHQCEIFLDTLTKMQKSSVIEAATTIKSKLQQLPTQPPTTYDSTPLGVFGDGFIMNIPLELREEYKIALQTSTEDNSCFYNAINLLIWGHQDRNMYLRLASTLTCLSNPKELIDQITSCYESEEEVKIFLSSATTDSVLARFGEMTAMDMIKEVVEEELTLSLNPQRDAGPIQCMAMALFMKRRLRVWTKYKKMCSSTVYNNNEAGDELQLVMIPTTPSKTSRLSHYVPVVDGRGFGFDQTTRETCGADIMGLCQGDTPMIQCSICLQYYHTNCLRRPNVRHSADLKCGCHKIGPLQPKCPGFYKCAKEVAKILQRVNPKKLIDDIKKERYQSRRWQLFQGRGGSLKERQFMKSRLAFPRFDEATITLMGRTLESVFEGDMPRLATLDVFYPEVAVHVTMVQEGLNRMEADMLLLSGDGSQAISRNGD